MVKTKNRPLTQGLLYLLFAICAIVVAVFIRRAIVYFLVPQFVHLTFDGGYQLAFWDDTLNFARGRPVKFTYFVSGAYLGHKGEFGIEKTNIGFGNESISARAERIRRAVTDGHEIASHAYRHFDGTNYTIDQWQKEVSFFLKVINDRVNNEKTSVDIRGFRAPYLRTNPNLNLALKRTGLLYNSSLTFAENSLGSWPFTDNEVLQFPLNSFRDRKGHLKSSMDFTSYAVDGVDLEPVDTVRAMTYEMYRQAFEDVYTDTRAPFVILTHFGSSELNSNAYYFAMKDFADAVCTRPHVRCSTMSEALDWITEHWLLVRFASGSWSRLISRLVRHRQGESLADKPAHAGGDKLYGNRSEQKTHQAG